MAKMCKSCGTVVDDNFTNCPNCGAVVDAQAAQPQMQQAAYQQPQMGPVGVEQKSKIVAGLLGIFLGAYGIHQFYLGNSKKGVIQLLVTFVTCGIGSLWGFIEGIMILCGSINTDANGVPLKD